MKLHLPNLLRIKVAEPKKRKSTAFKRESKITTGVVVEEEDENFKVLIQTENSEMLLPFTPKSFELKDRTTVFTRAKNERGHRMRIIRDAWKAKIHPGFTTQYFPFTKNWIVKGYIVSNGLVKLFDFKDLVGIKGYVTNKDE